MNFEQMENNKVYLRGKVVSERVWTHEVFGEGFYEMYMSIPRLSGQVDILPITVSERLLLKNNISIGDEIAVEGQFRSYNKIDGDKSRLVLTVFARKFYVETDMIKNPNIIVLTGFICKPPIYRTTPFNREIADILVAVNRAYNKSDYLPAIAWGRNARYVKNIEVGTKIAVSGRIQSREYNKKLDNDIIEVRTAYEISVSKIASGENMESIMNELEIDTMDSITSEYENTMVL